MNRLISAAITISLLTLFSLSCTSQTKAPDLILATDQGPAAWDSTGSAAVQEGYYLDAGDNLACLVVDAGNAGRLMLSSDPLPVTRSRPVSFAFALRTSEAAGELLHVGLQWLDDSLRAAGDTTLYQLNTTAGDRAPGDTRGWIEYTRVMRVPEGVSNLKISISSTPGSGVVSLGRCKFERGEGWLSYAASFSTHLGRNPEDKYRFTAGRFVSPEPPPAPSNLESSAGLVMFERKGWVGATPYANPRAGDRTGVLSERVPRGTVAPLAFAVKALDNLAGVNLTLTGEIAGEAGVLRTQPVLFQGRYAATRLEGSWSTVFGPRARMMEPPSHSAILKGENLYYWVDIPVPDNAAPGTYEGRITVQADDRTALGVPFRIEVADVTLEPVPDSMVVGMYYYPPGDPRMQDVQFRDMAAHGINGLSISGSFVTLSEAGSLRIDWDTVVKLDNLMALMRRYGMRRATPLYVADIFGKLNIPRKVGEWTSAHEKLFADAVRLMNTTAINRGWNPLMFFTVDEPANDPEHMELARHTLDILHKMPEITTLCDLNTPGSIEELSKYLDAVVIQISSVSPHTVEITAGKGLKTFFYLPSFGSSDVGWDAAFHRAIPGWFLPRSGTRGIYYFAYQSTTGDPYDELDGGHRDWCASYPAPDGQPPKLSPEWQGIRRGIEDLRLVHTIGVLASRCAASTDTGAQSAGRDAAARLAEIMEQIEPSGPAVIYQLHNRLETYIAEKWRGELLDQALRMRQALGVK